MGKSTGLYRPVGFGVGVLGGALASAAVKRVWKALGHGDAPDAVDEDRALGEVLAAAAVQGVAFAVARAAVQRGGAVVVRRLTGAWPG